MDETAVPDELARLWRIASESRLGRPAKLDVGRVVDAAVALADREGLAAATLPKVAESLGVTKMSLYRHAGSKDELLALMQDAAAGPVPSSLDGTGPWRERLRLWANEQRAVLARHPWIATAPVSGPPRGPNLIGWFDAGLRTLRLTGLDWGAKVGAVMLVGEYVRGNAQLAQGLEAARSDTGQDQAAAEQAYGRAMAALVSPERFPDAAALFASATFEDTGADTAQHDFDFGLDLILDGVAAAIEG
ncbi:TetR/AcrR family transcriptional regulator [Glycomyces algeriensis]|uniref:TetR family transcriptional regulator n=1 Tax=Glycomyces algeriensis TaxID=256037 RepID=A0A9W6LJ21_9ACTN|nr:TetR/AcrR family transcriptional regulator [Glycomyces algeriensis]MDA1366608.1 TetR/AcrR family transcriptional regulator [Glycomyces algeriensis]MDR7352265.1 AcrR family transcriptional regulator [Glycomyces algeriensis]GLI45000.1 TetR family transcriptional regulator [Glycomyces algeriensis]